VLLAPLIVRAEAPATTQATYANPLNVDVADPFIIRHDGVYWLYGTSSREGFKTWRSSDLLHWEPRGLAFRRIQTSWGVAMFWAPCVVGRNGTFYLYYSALGNVPGGKQHLRICVATSDSPGGPFKDAKAPLLELGKSTIDAHVFIDEDGKAYLYYALDYSENYVDDPAGKKQQSHIYVIPLGDDLISINGTPTFCTRPDRGYEGDGWNEAPFVFKHKQTYILMYSTHAFDDPAYNVCYATAKSPLGPWTKGPNNPVLSHTPDVSGPGHNCVIESPDGKELFCVYHVHKNKIPGGARMLAMDRMQIVDEADASVKVKVLGPTTAPQPVPSR
jgi:beta-xylosidase